MKKSDTDSFFAALRKKEYARLDQSGNTYLDFTGGNLYPKCLLDEHLRFLQNDVFGNPHSNSPTSKCSGRHINEAREAVLSFFNAEDYYCVFTSNASAALQIIGECYPFSPNSHLLLTADNHNSVNGLREYCKNKGGTHSYCPMHPQTLGIDDNFILEELGSYDQKKTKLFAYPAQSNASGVRHPLGLIKHAQAEGWDVLLDAAALVPTSKLDLNEICPDFVCISFYKMFGYPTGLGCLLIKRSKFETLHKPWFAGGTVSLVSVSRDDHFLVDGVERFENGTVNYLDIPAITQGLRFIEQIGMEKIRNRMNELTGLLIEALCAIRHSTGLPLIKIYGPATMENRGGTILMNFFDSIGQRYPFRSIEQIAAKELISFRTGCFCNPGIDEILSWINADQMGEYFANRRHAEYDDMTVFLGRLRGAIRISVGIPTSKSDIKKFVDFASRFLNIVIPNNQNREGLRLETSSSSV